MAYTVAFTQHHGKNRQYPKQQDCLWNGLDVLQERDLIAASYVTDQQRLVIAVADGVGSSPRAELASYCVLQAMACEIAVGADFNMGLIRRIHGKLCDAYAKGRTFGCATTLAAAELNDNRCVILNVGDSRVYRISAEGVWQQLSHDHTIINAMIESGEAEAGRDYGLFLHSLDSCLVADDDYTDFAIHRAEIPLQPGDSLLLCTDGVHDALPEAIFHQLFDSMLTPAAQVERWRQAVLDAGAPDNLSLLLVRCAA